MNLLRRFFGDRRHESDVVANDRRVKTGSRSAAASDRLERAVEELDKTVRMSRKDFCEMLQREGECLKEK